MCWLKSLGSLKSFICQNIQASNKSYYPSKPVLVRVYLSANEWWHPGINTWWECFYKTVNKQTFCILDVNIHYRYISLRKELWALILPTRVISAPFSVTWMVIVIRFWTIIRCYAELPLPTALVPVLHMLPEMTHCALYFKQSVSAFREQVIVSCHCTPL